MPPQEVHFRLALGENDGEDSYLIHSAKGVKWSNLPDDLIELLQKIYSEGILDFSLGCDGHFYIKWKAGGVVKSKLSKGLRKLIRLRRDQTIDRLTLGPDDTFWGVFISSEGTLSDNWDVNDLSLENKLQRLGNAHSPNDIQFVSLGADDGLACGAGGRTSTRSVDHSLKAALENAKAHGKTVMNVTLSPFTDEYWQILYTDGTRKSELPQEWKAEMAPYRQKSASLLSWNVNEQPGRTILRNVVEESPEYHEVKHLFRRGWKHPKKQKPDVFRIYEVELPLSVLRPYTAYRSVYLDARDYLPDTLGGSRDRIKEESGGSDSNLNERMLFHGTPRTCRIGNSRKNLMPCGQASCSLCCILERSFQVSCAGTAPNRNFMRFGRGIYTTSVSSKADDYNASGSYKAMLVARVVLGIGYSIRKTCQTLTEPPYPYHSVLGEVGEDLNYDEQVVYRDEAIRPAYLIIYES